MWMSIAPLSSSRSSRRRDSIVDEAPPRQFPDPLRGEQCERIASIDFFPRLRRQRVDHRNRASALRIAYVERIIAAENHAIDPHRIDDEFVAVGAERAG